MKVVALSQLAETVGGELLTGTTGEFSIEGYSTDTRSINKGDLFFCLSGDSFDGHDFVQQAITDGAGAVVVERRIDTDVPQLIVKDTRIALGYLAKLWRADFSMPIVGVTGSNGKTTVKQMLASIFCQVGSVQFTRANDNNEIGVPKTLLGLNSSHDYAVIEMGAMTFGNNGDVTVKRLSNGDITIQFNSKSVSSALPLSGEHNVQNAAAAAACCIAAGISLEEIAKGLAAVEPVKGRLNFIELADGITVIDDTYNANPASTRAAVDVLSGFNGKRLLVLGDLLELGAYEQAEHEAIGRYAPAGPNGCWNHSGC